MRPELSDDGIGRVRARILRCLHAVVVTKAFLFSTVIVFCLATVFAAGQAGAQDPPRLLELRGQVTLPPNTLSPKKRLLFTLSSMETPYSERAWGGFDGKFRFRNLPPGTYSLSIYIADDGEVLQTVDVTTSFADEKGRVEKNFSFDEASLRAVIRPVPQSLVSARLLAISYKAKSEYQKAQARLEERDAKKAIEHLQRAIKMAPTFAEAFNSLGTIYYQQRDFLAAERQFREALKQDRDAYEPLVNLGGALLAQKRWEKALAVNKDAHDQQPNDPLANAQLGMTYFALQDYENAIRYLGTTEELDPGHFSYPQIALAEIYMRQNSPGDAALELEEFLEIHPDSSEVPRVRESLVRIKRQIKEQDSFEPFESEARKPTASN